MRGNRRRSVSREGRRTIDNLAHTLAGAALGEAGLKEKTGLGLPTLMIAANLPDVDILALAFGENLAFRRGLTHGPIGLLILPPLLVGTMMLFDRWQARRGKRPEKRLPLHAGWLLALAYIGALSHPALDWLNTYGVRCLAPFSDRWFYGDTLFIIDVWMWTMLTIGVVWSQRRRRRDAVKVRTPAVAAIGALVLYIAAMKGFSEYAELRVQDDLANEFGELETVVASPVPIILYERELIYRTADRRIGHGYIAPGEWHIGRSPEPDNMDDPRVTLAAAQSDDLRDFLFWSRLPFARFEGQRVIVGDARYGSLPTNTTFTVEVELGAGTPPLRE